MGIGTSLGAFYEDEFHHQAGIATPPPATADKNEITPNQLYQDRQLEQQDFDELGGIEVSKKYRTPQTKDGSMPIPDNQNPDNFDTRFGNLPPSGILNDIKPQDNAPSLVRKISDIKTSSPLVTITDEDVDKGMSLGMGFAGGGFHATLDGLGLLSRLGGKISTSGDGLPATIHLQGDAHDALQEGPDAFQQFMVTRGRGQSSSIVDHPAEPPAAPAAPANFEQVAFTDHMSDEDFYRYGLQQRPGTMTAEQEARWRDVDRVTDPREDGPGTAPHMSDEDVLRDLYREYGDSHAQSIKNNFQENTDKVVTKGNISVLKQGTAGSADQYHFLSSDGIPGELSVSPKENGKNLYVNWIGTVGTPGPMDVGRAEMKNLFKLLSDQYPQAEKITGFRVSGARAAPSGGGSNTAEMRIPGRGAPATPQPQRQTPQQLLQQLIQ